MVTSQSLLSLFEQGRFQEIVQSIDRRSFSGVEAPLLTKIVAASYFQLGAHADALSLLKQVESCFVSDVDYLSLYGACLRRCGQLDDAKIQLQRALAIQGERFDVRNNFANLLIDLGDLDEAESILGKIIAENPGYGDAQVNLQRLKEQRNLQQLQSQAADASGQDDWQLADPLLLAFGDDEVQRTRPKPSDQSNAQPNLQSVLPPLKQQQVASDQLALALDAVVEGRHEFALKLCSEIHRSMPTSATLFECLSDAYIALQRFSEAEVCLLHALQLGARSFKLFANLTTLLCLRKDFALAQHYLAEAAALDASNSALSGLRGQIAAAQSGSKESLLRFDQEWSRPDLKQKVS